MIHETELDRDSVPPAGCGNCGRRIYYAYNKNKL
jgi:hypothetical protein